ncbi:MAG: insulinase family protein [Lachnospiraceae bacterium]|nr:insulinase family protein [Lachnospiraceae bacterium]
MADIRIPDSYELIERGQIEDIHSESLLLRHKKTRARVALLLNDDENKVFYIGFRTPPEDSTGVAHIIEHTVLCGSEAFPVKDPFMQLVKGSLNTFLNAMTYPDKTVYPVASCNDRDFKNLMHVYMDAVLKPRIYADKRFFMQEGWHYEMEDETADLTINGVVFNEMKGIMSSPESVVGRDMRQSLFPDTAYGVDSGGDPDVIPELTYEDYLEFHRTYYHPSNSYIYLYGNLDAYERLDWMDREYLSQYDFLEVNSMPAMQKPFDAAKTMHRHFAVLEGQATKGVSYLTYNVCMGDSRDRKLHIAFDVLDYALCDAPGAVLKQALLDKGLGADIYCSYSDGILQPAFSVVAKGTDAEREAEFVETIRDTLQRVVRDGFDKKALYAALNQSEFHYREADFGRYPKGLMYGLEMLDSWLFDDALPFVHIDAGDTYRELKEDAGKHYFEDLVQTYLLDNPHRTVVSFSPKEGLTEEKEVARKEALAAKKKALSAEEIASIVRETKELKVFQETPDREEDLRKIPMLTRADLKREADRFRYEERREGNAQVLFHDVETNGICYLTFLFDMEHVPAELYPYAGLLKTMLGMVDTARYAYADLANEVNIRTGGFSGSVSTYTRADDDTRYTRTFEISVKVLKDHLKDGFDLAAEILLTSDFTDQKRILEILEEMKSRMQDDLMYSGNQTAALRALSHISPTAKIADTVNGLGAYRLVESLTREDAIRARGKLSKTLKKLAAVLFRKENLLIDLTAPEADYAAFAPLAAEFADRLFTEQVAEGFFSPEPLLQQEAFQTAGQVQFVCTAGNFRKKGLPFTGRLRVLRGILSQEYFWENIRVKGGAYGCQASFGRNGDSYFVTYRDPHLKQSLDIFAKSADFVRGWDADERAMTGFVIGTISSLDTPKTPATKGGYGLTCYLIGITQEEIQKEREEVLNCTAEEIRAMAPYIEAILADSVRCVVGAAEKIDAARDLFDSVEPLIQDGTDAEEEAE